MSERTGVRTQVLDGIALDDPLLMQVPFLLLTVRGQVAFTQAEAKNLGRYLTSGGFIYTDIVSAPLSLTGGYQHDLPALRDFIRQAFQQVDYAEHKDWSFCAVAARALGSIHCFYDVDALPRGFWDIMFWYLEHFRTLRIVAQLPRGHSGCWPHSGGLLTEVLRGSCGLERPSGSARRIVPATFIGRFDTGADELPVYDLGVNIVVYALTREGSLARQFVDAD